jgi:hypothetical protein
MKSVQFVLLEERWEFSVAVVSTAQARDLLSSGVLHIVD